MTVPSNLYQKDSLKGNREDLIDKIFNTSPNETPITSSVGRVTATSTFHEWQRDSLASANKDNAAIDGDDLALEAQTATERVGNHLQIFTKRPGVSRRANLIKKAGRGMEDKYLIAKAMTEAKRDIEAMVVSNNAAVASTTSVAGKSAGLGVQLYLNTSHGGSGATASWTTGAPTTAVTAGTNRTLTDTLLKTVCQSIYTSSGQFAKSIYCSPYHKGVISGFTSIATNQTAVKNGSQATITQAASVYVSDFGSLEIIPHYLMAGSTDVFVLNTDYIDMAFLDGFQTSKLAKTGDSERYLITADCGLAVRSSAAQGKLSNLTAS